MPSLRKGAERLRWSVFDRAKVEGAYSHRFRHTFASELLAKGTTIEVVADLLGDSVAIVRKYYQKWRPEWQAKKDHPAKNRRLNLPQIFHKREMARIK